MRRYLPGVARACLMASTIEDSLRYWRDFGLYQNYFANLWMKPDLEQDFWTANFFIWPMILKIIPAMFVVFVMLFLHLYLFYFPDWVFLFLQLNLMVLLQLLLRVVQLFSLYLQYFGWVLLNLIVLF